MNDNAMLEDWRCNYLLLRPRNLTLLIRSTLYVAIIFVSFIIAVFVFRATDQQVLQQLLNALPLLENQRNVTIGGNQQQQHQIRSSSYRPSAAPQPARQQQHTSIILYWTKFFETSDFEVGLGSKPFGSCIHQVNTSSIISRPNCLTTTDRGLLNDSDAVIFHGRDLHVEDLPPPAWRRPHQMFIFFLLESPIHTDLGLLQRPVFRNYFNRTMTYRRDSDVVLLYAYGRLRCIDPAASPACLEFPRHYGNNSAEASAALYQHSDPPAAGAAAAAVSAARLHHLTAAVLPTSSSKDRAVAWFVSKCQSNSQRESLVRRLSQFIPVDIYGKCGDGKHSCPNRSECDRMLSRHYRFYLSFENSLCPDYVTEKLYRPLAHDTVPVVYGGADYSLYLPAGSYVNTRDFKNAEALANHLKKLMANDTLYSSYFDWKSQYTVDPTPMDGWCRLCQLLNEPLIISKKDNNKFVEDVASWWSGQTTNQTCSSPPKSLIV